MIHPSYSELMAVVNSEVEEGEQPLVQSRYSIKDGKKGEPKPLLTPEEARKLQIGTPLVDNAENMKPLSIAVQELYEGKVKIVGNGDDSDVM